MNNSIQCEFCNEIHNLGPNSFEKIYFNTLKTRIVFENKNFVVLPTIGQIFENSLLIIPKKHVQTLSELNSEEVDDLTRLHLKIKTKLEKFGHVIAFEHGAKEHTGGSCGIYHAHLHIMPITDSVNLFKFFRSDYKMETSLKKALRELSSSDEYLLAINEDNSIGIVDVKDSGFKYPSQFFRKQICEFFQLDVPWNWREYNCVEEKLINSVLAGV